MAFPAYFARIPGITLYDPLAELLGAPSDGLITYHFADAVRVAGHACPTVAGAWLSTVHALTGLYGDAVPERGMIRVELPELQSDGVSGVIASIVSLLTGAAGIGGFKGLAGQFSRRNLLHFGIHGICGIRFTRLDSGQAVDCQLHLEKVPADPRLSGLLQRTLAGQASPEERRLFGELWQARVEGILLGHRDDPALVTIHAIPR